jgi:hypothetical protein
MKCNQHRWLAMVAVAIVALAGTSSSLAVSVNPFSPSTADIQGLADNTAEFSSSNQLSTIDAIHIAPDGIHLDVTWRVGTGSDPFGTHPGENFARVVLRGFQNGESEGLGRLLNPPYDGIKWCVMSDLPIAAQPFVQTAPNWSYYQPASDPQIPGDMSLAMATLSFDSVQQGTGSIPLDDNNEIRSNAFGIQFFTSFAMTPGEPVQGHIWISNWVPEPSTAALMLLGMVGLIGRKRR